jgi:hypothetical protein
MNLPEPAPSLQLRFAHGLRLSRRSYIAPQKYPSTAKTTEAIAPSKKKPNGDTSLSGEMAKSAMNHKSGTINAPVTPP